MAISYTKDELWKIYKKLPQELQEAIFSFDTADAIFNSCERNKVKDVSKVAYHAGFVLMGFILPQEFAGVLEKEIKLPKTLADAVARDINRLVFYPVKPALEQLHRMEIEVSAKIVTPKPEEEGQSEKKGPEQSPRGDDEYREPLE